MLFKSRKLILVLLSVVALDGMNQTMGLARDDWSEQGDNTLKQAPSNQVKSKRSRKKNPPRQREESAQEAFEQDIKRLDRFRDLGDLDGLIRTADEIQGKWKQQHGNRYALLMLHVSGLIFNGNFSDTRAVSLSQKYALRALSNAEKLPLEFESDLLLYIQADLNPAGEAWANERRAKARLWLLAWRRLEKETDPNFDFNDRSFINVAPPVETGLPSGVPPEAIKDPRLRAKYEAALAVNKKKAQKFTRQNSLRFVSKDLPQRAEQYLVRAYSKPPLKLEELKRYLKAYVPNKETRERILSEVSSKTTGKKM